MTVMTWEEWESTYKPTPNPDSTDIGYWQAFYDDLADIPADVEPHHIWTMVDGDGRYANLECGIHLFNRLGYFVTEVPWNEDEEIYITNQKEF